jgi:anti-anti-sigma factor
MPEPTYEHVEVHSDQGVLVLTITEPHVEGDEIANALRDEVLAAVAQHGAQKVVVDFRHTEYISSVAFRPLFSLRRKLEETKGRMVLCGVSKAIGDVFYTTRLVDPTGLLTSAFEMVTDVKAAIARLTGPPTPP